MANFPSVTAAGAFESTAVQNAIKTLAEQAAADRIAAVIDARPWMIAPHTWTSATKVAVGGSSVTMTINARADTATAIPANTVIGNIPAAYRPAVEAYSLGQSIGGEGMRFATNGDIICPAVSAGAYFKVTATWTR